MALTKEEIEQIAIRTAEEVAHRLKNPKVGVEQRPLWVTVEKFRQMVDENEWFVQVLRNKTLGWWNFNICVSQGKHRPVLAGLEGKLDSCMGFGPVSELGYKLLDTYKGIEFWAQD